MSTYRIYSVKNSGQIAGPPALAEAETDREALIAAQRFGTGLRLEVWQLARLVATLQPDRTVASSPFKSGPISEPDMFRSGSWSAHK